MVVDLRLKLRIVSVSILAITAIAVVVKIHPFATVYDCDRQGSQCV